MRFNRNVSFDDMKERISAKIVRRCGRRILKLFYKFLVSTDPIKFTEMELLAGVESTEDLTAYDEKHGAQKLCMVASISYVNSKSTIRRIDINLNIAPNIDVVGDDGHDSSDPCDQEVDSDSDPDADEVPNDIDDEDVKDNRNINESSVGNQIRHPDAAHVAESLEYPEILPAHRLAVNSDPKKLFIGQRFESKEEWYSMNISMDYKVAVSNRHYILGSVESRWKAAIGGNKNMLHPVCHGDPFTASDISRLTSIEIIRMQTGGDKL
ncbi:hypothetical protein GOBAR_DD12050 [Gossypium barbadense]|nr:hypothetical protein GOBAR_DD12050 [Gossypium barbadense]